MFCYRGVWYKPSKQAKKPQKTDRVYRGIKHAA